MLFGSSKKSFLGIDIGANSIKLIELINDNHIARLRTYGYIEQNVDIVRSDSDEDFEKIVESIKFIIRKSKTLSSKVIASLPSYAVFSSVINVSAVNKKDLTEAIHVEAKKFIPVPLSEVVLNWQILNDSPVTSVAKEEKTTNYKILLTAAPKNIVTKFINIFKASGLELLTLDVESFATIRSLIGNDNSVSMICNIGDTVSSVMVVKDGIPVINRSIDFGGSKITENISKTLNIDEKQAEQFKKDQGLSGDLEDGISKIIADSLQYIVDEIKYALNIFQNQSSDVVEKIILTGGSSQLIGLSKFISDKFNKRTFLGNPWARVDYPEELFPILQEIGPKFSVSIGLAQKEAEK